MTIQGLLLVLAAVSAAAAAAAAATSTTTALAVLRLVSFAIGMMKFSNVYVYVIHGFLSCQLSYLPLHLAMQQECVAWLVLVDLDG